MTQADEDDPLKDKYGDAQLVQSQQQTDRIWSSITACSTDKEGDVVGSHCCALMPPGTRIQPVPGIWLIL